MEEREEAERLAWEAQVDEAVAVVSVAGEEAAALLARRRREGEGEEEEQKGGDESSGDFFAVDVGDDAQVSELREAGFEGSGPLQLRLLVEIEIPEAEEGEGEGGGGDGEGNDGGNSITLTVGGGGGGCAAASVSSLQPLRLAVALPRLYLMPSPASSSSSAEGEGEEEEQRIPAVSASAPWLSAAAASRLEARLRSLAREQLLTGEEPCPPVVFDLIELAKDTALAEALSASGGGGGGGRSLDLLEVVGDGDDPDPDADNATALALLRQLLSDDAAQRRERFRRGSHACCICLEEGVPGSRATALPCCGGGDGVRRSRRKPEEESGGLPPRAACTSCLAALAEAALRRRDASALACPFPDCREPLPPSLLSALLPPEEAELAESLRLERALAQMGALRCPHCDFAGALADAQGCCLCPRCRFAFCSTCFDAWHGSARECSSAEARLALARARAARAGSGESGSGGAGGGDRASSALALRKAEEEYLSLAAISRSGFKACPCCRTPIERTAGCNRMRCAACSTSFCFVCSAVIGEEEGYGHFGSGRCRLLSAEEIARWEREERGGQEAAAADRNRFWLGVAAAQQQRGGRGGNGNNTNNENNAPLPRGGHRAIKVSRCPTCGALHAGESNDRRCGNCKTRHCGSCGEVLRRGVLHFGVPPKCPAHF